MRFDIRVLIAPLMLYLAMLACIPPQDCLRTQYSILGTVQDSQGNPIAGAQVQLVDEPPDSSTPVMRVYVTDALGRFGTDSVSMFACANVVFMVSADGYVSQTIRYNLLMGQGHPQSLPDELVVTLEQIE